MEAVIFIGIQASGKSEFYKQRLLKTHIRLNMDMLRTRRRESILMKACIAAKQPFVVDNTNPSKTDRAGYITEAKAAKFKVTGYYFRSSITESLQRNAQREGKEKVPPPAIYCTHKKLELPDISEGFDELFYVETDGNGGFSVKEFQNEV